MAESHQLTVTTALLLSHCSGSRACGAPTDARCLRNITLDGWTYSTGDCIIVKTAEDRAELVEIVEIVVGLESPKVLGKKLQNVEYVNHLMAYRVCHETPMEINLSELLHYHPLGVYRVCEKTYVIPQVKSQMNLLSH